LDLPFRQNEAAGCTANETKYRRLYLGPGSQLSAAIVPEISESQIRLVTFGQGGYSYAARLTPVAEALLAD
jgi:CRISPR/Cas system-associated endonuclease Cas1